MFYKNNIKQGKKILVAFFTLTALYSFSQSNNPAPYCSANYSTGCAERFIAQVTAGGGTNIAHTSNACGVFTDGYAYYCNHFVGATAGQAITFTVMVGGITHQYGISAYIDWNGDNVFSTPAEQFALSGLLSVSAPYTFTVTIPPTQANGKYRLRIRLEQWGTANNPCTTFTRGETEDYDIYVGMQPPSPTALTATVSSNSPVCAGNSLLLNVNYTSTLVPTFNWSGPSSFSSTAQNPTVTNVSSANAGNYFVSVTTGTCPLTLKTNVSIAASPTIVATTSSSLICAGNQATLSASGANSYTWNPGGTGSVIAVNPTVTTQYTVTGNNGVCSSTTTITQSVQVCAGIHLQELMLDDALIYPNPFKDELKINSSTLVVVTLTDVAGKILMSKKVSGNSVINTSNYPSGMYFLNLKTEHQTITKKVIKE